jgi:hypothetical protein
MKEGNRAICCSLYNGGAATDDFPSSSTDLTEGEGDGGRGMVA